MAVLPALGLASVGKIWALAPAAGIKPKKLCFETKGLCFAIRSLFCNKAFVLNQGLCFEQIASLQDRAIT
jgi:hypothetical protein